MNIGLETTELTNLIGSNNGGEYSLINSLDLASNEWMNMGEISTGEIDRIIVSLNSIPKEVVTKHVIIEERRSSSQSSGNPISNLLRGRV